MKTTIRCLLVMLIPWLLCFLMGFAPHLSAQSGPVTINVQINSDTDDAEETIITGEVNTGSSDLELVKDDGDIQKVGMRFSGINVPQGVTITHAYIQFTTDNTPDVATNLTVKGQAVDDAATFVDAPNSSGISARINTAAAVNWAPPHWNSSGERGPNQQTPDLSAVIQEIVDRPGWTSGNALVLTVEGVGKRVAVSHDEDPGEAAELFITYEELVGVSSINHHLEVQINHPDNDAEENLLNGQTDLHSSDLELVYDKVTPQIVGMRFEGINIPAGAIIEQAYIQFTAEKGHGTNVSLVFRGEDIDDASGFTDFLPNNISSRTKTTNLVNWNPPVWIEEEAGPAQQTPDLSQVIQEIIDRPGWTNGNAIAILVEGGTKRREAYAYDGSAVKAPKLIIDYKVCESELADDNLLNFPFVVGQELFCEQEDRKQMKYAIDPTTGNIVVAWNRFIDPDGYDAEVYFAILDANYQLITPPAGETWPIRVDTEASTDLPSRGVSVEIEPSKGSIAIGYTKSVTGPVSQAHGQFYHRVFDANGYPLLPYASGGIIFNPQQACSSSNPNYCYEYTDHFDITWGPNNKLYFAFQPWGGVDWWARFPILINAFNVNNGTVAYPNAYLTFDISMNLDWRSLHSIEYDPSIGILVSEYRKYNIWSGPGSDFVGHIWDVDLTSSSEPFSLTGGLEVNVNKSDGHISIDDGRLLTSWVREPMGGGTQMVQAQISEIIPTLPNGDPFAASLLDLDVASFSQSEQVFFTQNDIRFSDNRLSVGYTILQNQVLSRRVHAYEFDNSTGSYTSTAAFPLTIYQDELDHATIGTGTTFYGTVADYHYADWSIKLVPGQQTVTAGGHIGEFVRPRSSTEDNATDWLISGADLTFTGAIQPCDQLPFSAAVPSTDQNYILSTIYRKEMQSISQAVDARDAWQSITYFDGLGRASQSQEVGRLPDGSTIIQPIDYDAFGRQPKTFMPYGSGFANGSFQNFPLLDQQAFYASEFPAYGTDRLFAESIFETSPLNRVLESAMPGDAWKPVSAGGDGHTSKSQTLVYGSTEIPASLVVPYFDPDIVPGDPGIVADYSKYVKADPIAEIAGDLLVQKSEDEDENIVFVFTDRLGRQLMQSVQVDDMGTATLDDDDFASTVYVYNEWGNPICIIQPEGVKELSLNGGNLDAAVIPYCFIYVYDRRQRVIEKTIPGRKRIDLVYDLLDRIVATQDGEQMPYLIGELYSWTFTKYNVHGEPIITGIYDPGPFGPSNPLPYNRVQVQAELDASTQLYEVRSDQSYTDLSSETYTGYTYDQTFPTQKMIIHSQTFLDDYNFDFSTDGSDDVNYLAESQILQSPTFRLRAAITGVDTRVLNPEPGMTKVLRTATFYNHRLQEIQTQADHLHGTDITTHDMNFAGEIETNILRHHGPSSVSITEQMCYLHNGSLKRITHQVNNDPATVLVSYDYDALGNQASKHLYSVDGEVSYLQDISFDYNIQGWLGEIDAPGVFNQQLFYQEVLNPDLPSSVKGLYNGNISSQYWSSGLAPTEDYVYGYEYDRANRLKDAHFVGYYVSGQIIDNSRFNVHDIQYDLNGNILQLKRNGLIDISGPSPTYGLMDDLSYTYNGNQLTVVNDAVASNIQPDQFIDGYVADPSTEVEYLYDDNGNLIEDKNKEITIQYDVNNLAIQVDFVSGPNAGKVIRYIRDAAGTKLQQRVDDGSGIEVTDYIHSFHYRDDQLLYFGHEEGRIQQLAPGQFQVEFFIQDHLGSNRATIADLDGDGSIDPLSEIVQADHFYPFGVRMGGMSMMGGEKNRYLYTGKEALDEYGLAWVDFGARMYDAAIGRWGGVDALAEKYREWSPYNHVMGNPIRFIDPNGFEVNDTVKMKPAPEGDGSVDAGTRQGPTITARRGNPENVPQATIGWLWPSEVAERNRKYFYVFEQYQGAKVLPEDDIWGILLNGHYGRTWTDSLTGFEFCVDSRGRITACIQGGTLPVGPGGVFKGAGFLKTLPALDKTRKVHGALPRAKDLVRFSKGELRKLLRELKISVQQRIKVTSRLGRHRSHGQRQGAEQDLIKTIEKYLNNLK
ncbi:MAG: DUF6443 domain-containing protein [Bacteroidota bacterium]